MAKLFFSYSHKDEKLRNHLEIHLAVLKRDGFITTWHDRRIPVGAEFDKVIDSEMESADIILLLLSPDFLASSYINDIEVKKALERHQQRLAQIIPVILKPCDWRRTVFGTLLAAPTDGKPVTKWSDRNEAFLDVVDHIRAAVPKSTTAQDLVLDLPSVTEKRDERKDHIRQLSEAAEQGDAKAQFNLGCLYESGEGVPKDLGKAAELYQKAADQGNAEAQFKLGCLYQSGDGVPMNLDGAVEFYQKAAKQGHAQAQFNLGRLYEGIQGVPEDLRKAVKLYQKAAKQGHAWAQARLGWMYHNHVGVPKDLRKAAALYQKAADQGHAVAQFCLGLLYEDGGEGVPQDLRKAAEFYQKAANQGHAWAQAKLGRLYEDGKGVLKDLGKAAEFYQKAADLHKAAELYQKAADQGNANAQNNLGELYEQGAGVTKDISKAVELYRKAAAAGHEAAKKNLERLQKSGATK